MKFAEPLKEGIFRRRYKRFFAEVDRGGETITCHLPNTGSLKGCLREGAPCLFSVSTDPSRKLPYTLQMVKDGGAWVGVNTSLANAIVWEAWKAGEISSWLPYDGCQREVRLHAQTRLDLAMWKGCEEVPAGEKLTLAHVKNHKFHFVEIKSVTMAAAGIAMFPDAVTERGQKHLREMTELVAHGHTAELVFLVQRNDCLAFSPADHIDPKYGKLLRQAILEGVKVTAFPCDLDPTGIRLGARPCFRTQCK
jgi:sugar fermentation stimulation protein A